MVARSEEHKAMLNERVTKAQERYGYLSEEFKSDATRDGQQQDGANRGQQAGQHDHNLAQGPVPPGGFPQDRNNERAQDEAQNDRDDEQER